MRKSSTQYGPEYVVQELRRLFQEKGHLSYGEGVSQQEHMLQCAALAKAANYDNEVVIAAFLHDVGHLLEGTPFESQLGNERHEDIAAAYLISRGFSKKVISLVQSHVAAKRYLVFRDTKYYDSLSEASKATLKMQGGQMSILEAIAFESEPYFELKIQIRMWDDRGKATNLYYPNGLLERYLKMVEEHLQLAPN